MLLSLIGVYQTERAEKFEVDIRIKKEHYYSSQLQRTESEKIDPNSKKFLRVFQITDPHLGKNKK